MRLAFRAGLAGLALLVPALGFAPDAAAQTVGPAVTPSPTTPAAPAAPSPTVAPRRITIGDARAALDAGKAILVDVRGQEAFEIQHAKGALSIPLFELAQHLGELPHDKLIITYCT
ncbi:MAG: rhodanese-like domain-containing protein [Thermoanaerobaculia bacterium]